VADPDPDQRDPDEWLAGFAAALGVDPPDADTVETLLALAGVAAHASARSAAPIACYLVGRAGIDPVAARARADQV
jgi:Domain of unknown function (DUF6457)